MKKALAGPLDEGKLGGSVREVVRPTTTTLCLLSGVGIGWPLLRVHSLLNNLHSVMGQTPLVRVLPRALRRPVAAAVRQVQEPTTTARSS